MRKAPTWQVEIGRAGLHTIEIKIISVIAWTGAEAEMIVAARCTDAWRVLKSGTKRVAGSYEQEDNK